MPTEAKRSHDTDAIGQPSLCPECGSDRLVRDARDELHCERCGLVLESSPIDPGPDWRAYTAKEESDRARAGAPMTVTLHDKGLATTMGWPGRDARGNPTPTETRAQLHRLQTWNRRMRMSSGAERNLAHALSELQRMTGRIGAPRSVRETASAIYRDAMEAHLVEGRTIDSVAAASLYAACRRHDLPRTLEEIADVSPATKKEIGRTFRAVARELDLELRPTTPEDFVQRFAAELSLSPKARRRAVEILEAAQRTGALTGKSPTGVAGAALYLAGQQVGDERTQSEVAEVAHVSEVTIRNRAKDLEGVEA